MLQAAENSSVAALDIAVDFDSNLQSLAALEAAAYRLIGMATCQIDRVADRFVCRLTLLPINSKRENIGVRNVILALAFGSLAASQSKPE
jgi:hypothetical protein